MAASYYRALATCAILQKQVDDERDRRTAMEMCFKKIYGSLEMYKGKIYF